MGRIPLGREQSTRCGIMNETYVAIKANITQPHMLSSRLVCLVVPSIELFESLLCK